MAETFQYYKVVIVNGKMDSYLNTLPIYKFANEIRHFNLKSLGELVERWDMLGRACKKYRYFLISPDVQVSDLMRRGII